MNSFKKWLKAATVPLVLAAAAAIIPGCQPKADATTAEQQIAAVQLGNITLEITAVGNLAYSQTDQLSFDTGGTIADIPVGVGDSVKQGQELATLDMTEYLQNITSLESVLTAKKLALTTIRQQEKDVSRNVDVKERDVANAERVVENAVYNVNVKERDVMRTQLEIESMELSVEQAQYAFDNNSGGMWAWDNLVLKKKQLELTRYDLDDAQRAVETAKQSVADAQSALNNAGLDVLDAQTSLTLAQANTKSAEQVAADAQKALDDANATSPRIVAPYDGLVTAINTPAGEKINKGGAVVTIADPTKYEANIAVGENDISNVQLNGESTVELDALPGILLHARVTAISPTASTSQGVVTYSVTVTVDPSGSMQPLSQQDITPDTSQSGQTGQMPFSSKGPGTVTSRQENVNVFTGSGSSVELRQGLTATVNIIYRQAEDVLLVPTQAITRSGGTATVNVTKDGTISSHQIKTGLSDSRNTEVTEGLSEGDQVVYTRKVSSSSSSGSGGNLFINRGVAGSVRSDTVIIQQGP
jgi:multidrug efflux pump subunit AcrA (membrane-fusion protein)